MQPLSISATPLNGCSLARFSTSMCHHRHVLLAFSRWGLSCRVFESGQRSGGRTAILTPTACYDNVWRADAVLIPAGIVTWCSDLAFWCQLPSVETHVCKLATRLGVGLLTLRTRWLASTGLDLTLLTRCHKCAPAQNYNSKLCRHSLYRDPAPTLSRCFPASLSLVLVLQVQA